MNIPQNVTTKMMINTHILSFRFQRIRYIFKLTVILFLTIIINISCTKSTLVPIVKYGNLTSNGKKVYRIKTTDKRQYEFRRA